MPMMHTTCPIALMGSLAEVKQRLLVGCFQSLLELVNSTARINELLLTGKEGMALRANFDSHFSAFSGLSCYGLAASTLDRHFFIIRMNSGLHFYLHLTFYKYSQCTVLYHKLFKIARVFAKIILIFSKNYNLLYKSSRKRAIIFFSRREI